MFSLLVRYFDGIVELAVHTASIRDHQNLALNYYDAGQTEQPGLGYDAFMARFVRKCRKLLSLVARSTLRFCY